MSFGDKFRVADKNKNLINPASNEAVLAGNQKIDDVRAAVVQSEQTATVDAAQIVSAVQDVEQSADETTAAVNATKTSVDSVKTAVNQNNTSVGLVKTAVDAVKSAVDLVKTAVDTVAARVTTNTTAVEAVQEDCDGVTANRSAQCGDYVVSVSQPGVNTTAFFTNPDFGVDMAMAPPDINPVVEQWVYGGGLTGEPPAGQTPWAASQLSGSGWEFDETGGLFDPAAYEGAFYVDASGGSTNSEAVFAPPVGATYDTSAANALVVYLYITSWNLDNQNRDWLVRFRDAQGNTLGNELSMKPYVPDGSENQWIPVTVPLSDFGLTTSVVRDMVFKITSSNVNVRFDSIQFQAVNGSGTTFSVEPPPGLAYVVEAINWTIIDDHTITATGQAAVDDYKLGDVQLINGLLFEFGNSAGAVASFVTKSISDVRRVGAQITCTEGNPAGGAPGVRVMTRLKSDQARPFILRSSSGDFIRYTVREDLTDIITLQICAICGVVAESDLPERY